MKENVNNGNQFTPMLFPYDPCEYWEQIRQIVREEVKSAEKERAVSPLSFETPGLTYKPLFKM